MKTFELKTVTKKILIAFIVVITISGFIIPNYVQAETAGEKIVSGLSYLAASLGDEGIKLMQKIFVGTSDIKESGKYAIKYSPGVIFSGNLSVFDINFINPEQPDPITTTSDLSNTELSWEFLKNYITINDLTLLTSYTQFLSTYVPNDVKNLYGFEKNEAVRVTSDGGSNAGASAASNTIISYVGHLTHDDDWNIEYFWIDNGKLYQLEFVDVPWSTSNRWDLYVCDLSSLGSEVLNTANSFYKIIDQVSPAYELRTDIAKWYVALRNIAIIGLLSVLLYLGIRIIISSTSAQNKAKYKEMLKDWFVAMCILFVLHYIMLFMLSFTDSLNSIINSSVITQNSDGSTSDTLMNYVREQIGDDLNSASDNMGYTIMYLVLVILTLVFTFQYLKRVIYIAFLTMIAPMIALTYPLDKVRDGKAQAFSFWLKEFIVNCLIQPVHLLLYTILIGNAISFAQTNMLYAIVALTFLMPAEKVIKEMFGLKSNSSFNALGSIAGGAMVMGMLNRVRGVASGAGRGSGGNPGSGSGGGSNNNVRIPTRSPSSSGGSSGGGSDGGSGGFEGSRGDSSGGAGGGPGGGLEDGPADSESGSGGSGGSSSEGSDGFGGSSGSAIPLGLGSGSSRHRTEYREEAVQEAHWEQL